MVEQMTLEELREKANYLNITVKDLLYFIEWLKDELKFDSENITRIINEDIDDYTCYSSLNDAIENIEYDENYSKLLDVSRSEYLKENCLFELEDGRFIYLG